MTHAALKLAPLVFVRPGKLRQAEWSEINLDAAEWRIPAHRMKMRELQLCRCRSRRFEILRGLRPLTASGRYAFPSLRTSDRPMSENTINATLRRLGYSNDEMTGHGFRAMASTWLNEQSWRPDVIELQLAHAERNKVRAASNRTTRHRRWLRDFTSERDDVMQGSLGHLPEYGAHRRIFRAFARTTPSSCAHTGERWPSARPRSESIRVHSRSCP
jgi:integrase